MPVLHPGATDRLPVLVERIREIERCAGADCGKASPRVEVTFPDGRNVLIGGAVHEWFLEGMAEPGWAPPLVVLTYLSRRALELAGESGWAGGVIWIGRRCWPYPPTLGPVGDGGRLLNRSIFVDPPDADAWVWAVDVALRSSAFAAVVADASGLSMAGSRRLQLAAQSSGGLALLARPPRESGALSAATTRWIVRPTPSPGVQPRWRLELVRCKGMQAMEGPRTWVVERDHAQGIVTVPADVGDRSGQAAPAAGETARRTA